MSRGGKIRKNPKTRLIELFPYLLKYISPNPCGGKIFKKNPKPRLIELFLYPAPLSCERGFFNLFVFFVIIFIKIVFYVLIVITQYLGWKLNFWSLLPFLIFNGRSKFFSVTFSVPSALRLSAIHWSVKKAGTDSFPHR